MHDCRLLVDPAREGAWNMALDEALLESAGAEGSTTLRFYRWAEPTLSLGYFQRVADRVEHAASRNCPLVRRQTGGGAIVHDREWTYSFAAPAGSPLASGAMALYESIHGALIEALSSFGVTAWLWDRNTLARSASEGGAAIDDGSPSLALRASVPVKCPHQEAFLCFRRRAPGDVLLEDAKIAGCAQRRRRGAMLQHGSLILWASAAAPEISGLCEQRGCRIDEAQLQAAWQERIAERLRLRLIEGAISDRERAAAEQLAREKYSRMEWSAKR